MAQPVINGAIVRCRFVWEWSGTHAYVCRTFRVSPRPTGCSTLECAVVADALVAPLLDAVVGPQWSYIGTWCRRLLPSWDGSADETSYGGPYGTLPIGEPLPAQVCSLLLLDRPTNPPRNIGKMFLPSPTVVESVDGEPTAMHLANLAALATALNTTHVMIPPGFATALGLTPCLGVFTPTANTLVTSITVANHFGTQRRRAAASKVPTAAPFDSTGVS